ncbi:MAG: SpoIIE family protein phosphatase [Anaerolineae bacterium]|nr:SpoIIE family protein phosphatase [Anaerolineae bacterium]
MLYTTSSLSQDIVIPITDHAQIGDARRRSVKLAASLGFDEVLAGKTAIAVTELASNLAKYSPGGVLLLKALKQGGRNGLEIRSLDKGPGMSNVSMCLEDGYSTSGSAGTGLGAVSRLATQFDIYSMPQLGTAILARLWGEPPSKYSVLTPLEFGAVCLPLSTETHNGDGWATWHTLDLSRVLVVDGLGHGPLAETAATETIRIFLANPDLTLARLVETLHTGLTHTRGVSLAVAEIDYARQVIHYVGVGNISGAIVFAEGQRGLVSLSGTVGHTIRKAIEFTYPYSPGELLVLHSDGITRHWNIGRYPGLFHRHPSLIAGRIYYDYARGTDDLTIWVGRLPAR